MKQSDIDAAVKEIRELREHDEMMAQAKEKSAAVEVLVANEDRDAVKKLRINLPDETYLILEADYEYDSPYSCITGDLYDEYGRIGILTVSGIKMHDQN